MQYIEGRHFNMDEVLAVLQMSRVQLGIPNRAGTAGNQGDIENSFHEEVIFPLQSIIEDEINNSLIWRIFGWDDIIFQHREGDPRRKRDQADIWDKHQKNGRISINEVRSEMGYGPVKGGDIYTIQTAAGLIPVDIILEVAKRLLPGAESGIAEPISGVGTDTFGDVNPEQALDAESLSEV
jgi:hypothetical protein